MEIARAHLGIDARSWELLTRPTASSIGDLVDTWGPDPASFAAAPAPQFLRWTGMTYEALTEIDRLSGLGLDAVTIDTSVDPCDTRAHVVRVDPPTPGLDSLYRFTRLAHLTGQAHRELHDLLIWLGASTIDEPTLIELSKALRLADTLSVATAKLAAVDRAGLPEMLGLAPAQLDLIVDLTGHTPYSGSGISVTGLGDLLRFLARLTLSNLSPEDLAYLLDDRDTAPPSYGPRPGELEAVLDELGRNLAGEPTVPDVDPDGEPGLRDALVRRRGEVVETTLSEMLGIPRDVVQVLASIGPAGGGHLDSLLAFLGELDPPASADDARRVLLWLRKIAVIVAALELDAHDLRRLPIDTADGTLDALGLVVPAPSGSIATGLSDRIARFELLVDALALRRQLPGSEDDLLDLISADHTDLSGYLDRLTGHTGWDRTTVQRVVEPAGLGLHDRLGDVATYRLLHELFRHLARWPDADPDPLGTLLALGDPTSPHDALAARLLDIVRARDVDAWPEGLAPLADGWREQERDALLAWLIDRRRVEDRHGELERQFESAADVSAHYLIDMEMSSCQLTSRVKQATASLQLFIQRILLGLEDGVAADSVYWDEWRWRKNYRVWEAAMKVFIHPENWLEPQFRDLKTQQFEELTTKLLQSEITDESATDAYVGYVDELIKLAGLDYQAIHEEPTDQGTALHLVARTPDEPHIYHYRRRRATSEWEPWERIPIRIDSNHILPVIWNGRLTLVWLTCRRAETGRQEDHDVQRCWDVFLHWATRRDATWSSVQGSESKPLLRIHYPTSDFVIHRHGPERLRLAIDRQRPLELVVAFQSEWGWNPAYAEIEIARVVESNDGRSLRLVPEIDSRRVDGSNLVGTRTYQSFVPHRSTFAVEELRPGVAVPLYDGRLDTSTEGEVGWNLTLADDELVGDAGRIARAKRRTNLLEETSPRTVVITSRARLGETTPLIAQVGRDDFLVSARRHEHAMVSKGFAVKSTDAAYRFERLDHPFFVEISRALSRNGVEGLLEPASDSVLYRQSGMVPGVDSFEPLKPTTVVEGWPLTDFDFSFSGAQSLVNWEAFYHIPLMIGDQLKAEGRFEEARWWYRRVFDPTDRSTTPQPARYFNTKPLHQTLLEPPRTVEELLENLAAGDEELRVQVDAWRADPFNPHALARLRPLAYAKSACFKNLDLLIAWGDHLFALDTIESINEATQLYLEASRILGDRPTFIQRTESRPSTYALVRASIGELSNFLDDIETGLPALGGRSGPVSGTVNAGPDLQLHFCVPANPRLLTYWDTVADRLFKVRHCLDLQGSSRQLALYEPPIDPGLLVRARAAGLDLREVLSRTGAASARPTYRYGALYARAVEVCDTVRGFGSQLLSVLEKRDAEALGTLRAGQDRMVAELLTDVRQQQIYEAKRSLDAVDAAIRQAEQRRDFYATRDRTIAPEEEQSASTTRAGQWYSSARLYRLTQSIISSIPDTALGFASKVEYGGTHLSNLYGGLAAQLEAEAGTADRDATLAGLTGSTERRWEDWQHQAAQAALEVEHLQRQRLAAEIRQAIAEAELDLQRRQLEHAAETESFLLDKFSNGELYGWMTSQLMALHYQAYRLVLDAALLAQTGAAFELGLEPGAIDVIRLDHWNAGRKGLLAGDLVRNDLNRLDDLFRSRNARGYELTKQISLKLHHPDAFDDLVATGSCEFELSEENTFGHDQAGSGRRLIRSVAVTVPAVTGPYTNINGSLRMLGHFIRRGAEDVDFVPPRPPQRITLSHGRADRGRMEGSGLDERYEPFELLGAVSHWRLEIPLADNAINAATVNDAILTIHYTTLPA